MRKNLIYELIALVCGATDVDFDEDFGDDGYADWLGRTDIGEPLFISDVADAPQITVVRGRAPAADRRA